VDYDFLPPSWRPAYNPIREDETKLGARLAKTAQNTAMITTSPNRFELVKARRLRACRTSLSRSPLERPRPLFGDERYALLAGEEFVLEPALDFDRDLLEVVFVRIEVRFLYQDGS
jgi:hypothetical protein